jgi:hypothetical protein
MYSYKKEIINFLGWNIGKTISLMNNVFIFTYMAGLAYLTIRYDNVWKYSSFWFGLFLMILCYRWLDWLGSSISETFSGKIGDKK